MKLPWKEKGKPTNVVVYRKTKTESDPVWLVELRVPRKYLEHYDEAETKMNDDAISTQDATDGAMLQQGVDPTAQMPADPLGGGI